MEYNEPKSLGELLKDFIGGDDLSVSVMEGEAKQVFRQVAGSYVSGYVEDAYVRGGVLYIRVSSAVVRSEIHMRRRFYIKSVNEVLGRNVVRSISLK